MQQHWFASIVRLMSCTHHLNDARKGSARKMYDIIEDEQGRACKGTVDIPRAAHLDIEPRMSNHDDYDVKRHQ